MFVEQLMGRAGGLAQTYAKASDEFRRAGIDKLKEFIVQRQMNPTQNSAKFEIDTGRKTTMNLLQFSKNTFRSTGN